jgi:predicted nuclease of predicted toxin-antitoxin system
MTVKLLLDEDVHLKLAESLQQYGIDAIHVQERNRTGQSDLEQLQYAVEQKRCIFTFNVGDFVRLHKAFILDYQVFYPLSGVQ